MTGRPTAAERRLSEGAALVAAHPRWHGIRHPELISPPPRRFSQLDMLPAIENRPSRYGATRAERSRAIVAAHARWRGIKHPERLDLDHGVEPESAMQAYRAAVRVALAHVRDSEQLYRRIDAVATAIDRRRWPWGGAPSLLKGRPPARSRRWPSLPNLRGRARPARLRPHARLLPH